MEPARVDTFDPFPLKVYTDLMAANAITGAWAQEVEVSHELDSH
jgi:hypothetical protein